VSTCSARSAARTNDVDTDKRRETINDGGKRGSLQSVEDGQGPAPAGELAGDRGVGDHGPLAAGVEASPPGMQAPVRPLPAIARGGAGPVLPAAKVHTDAVGLAVMPGRFDQQPAGVSVSGLGDLTL
jgi:hypothetical protein